MPDLFDFDAFGSAYTAKHLHHLRVEVSAQCDEICSAHGVASPSHCSSLILLLASAPKGAGLTELARRLGYSHQLINQRLKLLEQLSILRRVEDPSDRRKKLAVLTAKGKSEAKKLKAVLPLLSKALDDVFREIGFDVLAVTTEALSALHQKPMAARLPKKSRK